MSEEYPYNTIYVIESLAASEIHTGTKLHELIKNFEFKYSGVKTFLKSPDTKTELFEVLFLINNSVQNNNCLPLIHLEIHGNQLGVECANKDFITWEELFPYFTEINIKLRNTLIITTGICHGAFFYFDIDINKPAPFFTLISSIEKVSNEIILSSYEKFYMELFNSENLNNAVDYLDLDFIRPTDNELLLEPIILSLINHYNKSISNIPGFINFHIINENKIITLKDKNELLDLAYNKQKQIFIDKLKSIWLKFLMIDLYPETKVRYKHTINFILKSIKETPLKEALKKNLIKEVLNELG